ncbi:hypothetical protein [Aquimarina aggregata]|uniref:hypothetical protein n=1 Tax=Aquimarina aggregata TaxID=1642818 RepID=UPI0024918C61|nr:hypothetical protein [Aquimarina aggregata]
MESIDYKVSKSTVECYKIRCDSFYWADITIDASGNQGRIQIASDFGNWQNYWSACGMPFKDFLKKLNIGYFASKVGADKWFDLDKTIEGLREHVNDYAQDKDLKDGLKKELSYLELSDGKDEFIHKMYESNLLMDMTDQCPDMVYSIEPSFQRFWDELWPVFIAETTNEDIKLV